MAGRFGPARLLLTPLAALLTLVAIAACGGDDHQKPTLSVGGIPDQDAARLARRYDNFADYLSEALDVEVRYVPSTSYSAIVTAFTQGDVQLAFFGGFTGVQARLQNPGARAIAQREHDTKLHSKFIVRADLPIHALDELEANAGDLTFTFGSESSTSGHLMPRHFLIKAGIDPDRDFRSVPNYSGSHDLTWKLVESSAFDVGALNEDVWDRALRENKVDQTKVREFYTTPDYFDYNWTVRPDLDEVYGDGFVDKISEALLALNTGEHRGLLELFSTENFIETRNENYQELEEVARGLGMVQ